MRPKSCFQIGHPKNANFVRRLTRFLLKCDNCINFLTKEEKVVYNRLKKYTKKKRTIELKCYLEIEENL
ncbi:hypothetical protein EGQ50_00920 [Coxiella endosymbiont of Amblyomma sculptum]|nr:hypothetical protein EGQ50_00920 [Coxiella endosymbiont of Amblyomma sculptum]